jgi:N-acylneuraminate cytidylyltransferase
MKDVIALIPARSGSKGIPDKNIQLFGGIPLIAFSIAIAKKSKLIDRVIVSTDSQKYAEIALEYGAEVPFIRPTSISGDNSSDIEFINHAISWLEENESFVPNFIAHLRPTTPIRDFEIVDDAIRGFVESDYSALRSCHKMSESSFKTFEIENNKLKCVFNGSFDIEIANHARQAYPETYNANGYIDIIRTNMVKKYGLIHGDCAQAFVTEPAYELDEKSDVDLLEYFLNQNPQFLKSLFG